MCESRWRVLHVVMNHEKRVAQHLTMRSVEQYLPLYTERSRWSDRFVNLERPLFTGYIFARFASASRLSVLNTPGVLRLLGDAERDTVSELEIARIRDGLASGCLLRPHQGIALGARARVLRGIFEGVEGVVTELRQQCRVIMTLTGTGQYFSLEVGPEDIEILLNRTIRKTPGRERPMTLHCA